MPIVLLILALIFTGCTETRTELASYERTRGVQAGHPVDLTTVRQERANAVTDVNVDLGPMIQTAVSAAMGDMRGVVSGLAGQMQTLAAKPAAPTTQELKAIIAEVGEGAGMDPETAGVLGGAGGLLLFALREWMAHRRTKKDYDQDWNDYMKPRSDKSPTA